MSIFQHAIEVASELIAPMRCAGCERGGELFCDECRTELETYQRISVCPRCGAPYGELVCTECADTHFDFDRVIALGLLEGALSRAIVLFKDGNERRLGAVLAQLLAQRVMVETDVSPETIVATPVTRKAFSRRGYDQGEELAREMSRCLNIPWLSAVRRGKAVDLRGLSKDQRRQETVSSFELISSSDIAGKKILLVDDVFTTGATVQSVTQCLVGGGAKTVTVAVAARTW